LVDGERREDALGDSVRRPLDILNGHACVLSEHNRGLLDAHTPQISDHTSHPPE
jgi:hypothetical protein